MESGDRPEMTRLMTLLAILAQAPVLPAAEPGYAELARRFADAMITQGTDRWGREHSPQFASMLLRASPAELLPDAVFPVEPRGVNRMHVQNLPNIYKGNDRAHKINHGPARTSMLQMPGHGKRSTCSSPAIPPCHARLTGVARSWTAPRSRSFTVPTWVGTT